MAGNEKILVELILKDKDFQKGIKDAVKDTQQLGKEGKSSGQMLSNGFKIAAAAVAAIGLKELITDLAKTAATTQSVESAFNNSFDPSVLNSMRKAVNGTVDDLSLMQKALNAKNLRIPIETLNAGLKLAKQRAAETGESVEFLAQSVVLGLGRESALILDNLGISAKRLSDEAQRTGDFMSAAAKIINDELANAPKTVSSLADGFAQSNAELENIRGELSKELIPALLEVNKIALEYLKIINAIRQGQTPEEYKRAADEAENFELQVSNLVKSLEGQEDARKLLKDGIDKLNQSIDRTVRIYGETRAAAKNAYKTDQLKIYEEALKRVEQQANRTKNATVGGSSVDRLGIRTAQATPTQETSGRDPVQTMMLYNDELEKMGDQWGMFAEADAQRNLNVGIQEGISSANAMSESLTGVNEELTAGDVFAMNFADTMVDGLFEAIAAGENFGEVMRNVLKQLLIDLTKTIIKMAILNTLFPGTGGAIAGGVRIPRMASGTNMFGGGLTLVGEYGPELVSLPKGSSITSASKTAGMMGGGEMYSRIAGEDIYLSSKRYQTNRMR